MRRSNRKVYAQPGALLATKLKAVLALACVAVFYLYTTFVPALKQQAMIPYGRGSLICAVCRLLQIWLSTLKKHREVPGRGEDYQPPVWRLVSGRSDLLLALFALQGQQ